MEFLKTCNTNAQAIGDFEAVAFQAFSVARNPQRPSSRTLDWNVSDDIRVAEAELRRENHIVLQDASRPWLWLFRATTADQVGQPPLDLPTVDDFLLNREQHGVVKALELEQRATRNSRNAASSAFASSPINSRPHKGLQSNGSQQSQSSSQSGASEQQQYDAITIYGMFTSAVVALISFHLVKDYNAVALNHRTFASSSAVQEDAQLRQYSRKPPLLLTDVDVFWATAGTLVVSTFSLVRPDIHCLADVIADVEQKNLIGRCVRVSPNGTLAKIISFADPADSLTEDGSQRTSRKRPKISPLEKGIERWKTGVRRWLAWKGYHIGDLEKKDAWLRIQFAHVAQPTASSPAFSRPAREIIWPRALCFYFSNLATDHQAQLMPATEELHLQEHDALAWFETSHSKGFEDPLDVAQQWFQEKPERDRIAEAHRKAKKAEEDAARAKEESRNMLVSSPINARLGAYGELQSVSGVYPTPPDGVMPGTVVSCGDTPGVSGVATNVILAPGDKNPAINLSAPQDTLANNMQGRLPTSPNLALPFEDYNADGNNDDLFEDMDEVNYEGGNGVTDADFNFFDDPDGDDVMMPDAPSVDVDGKAVDEKLQEDGVAAAPEVNVKEEPPDPMAALEFALASASANDEIALQGQQPEEHKESTPSKRPQQSPGLFDVKSEPLTAIPKVTTPPLSPQLIVKALLPSPEHKTPQQQLSRQHRESVFDPLTFSRKISLSDAKYKGGRFGFASGKPRPTGEDGQTRLTSLRDLPLMTKLRYAMGVASAKPELITSPMDASDSDESDTSSETSESDDEVDDVPPKPFAGNLIIPIKRKLPTESVATPLSATSFAESYGGDFGDLVGLQMDDSALIGLEPSIWDWTMVFLPPPMEHPSGGTRWVLPAFASWFSSVPSTPTSLPDLSMNLIEEKPLSGKDKIAIAQIVTDQIVSATLNIFEEDFSSALWESKPFEPRWHSVIKDIFPKALDCNVAGLAAVQDAFPDMSAQMKGQQRPPPRRPNETATALGHHMFQLNPPYIRVRRADMLWELLPPAIPFWETLGLGPCSPPKNVVAFSIYPHSEALAPCVESFLVNMQLAYDSCKLGNHARVDTVKEYVGGLVPWKLSEPISMRTALKAFRDTCVQLSKALAAQHAQMRDKDESKIDAFVIYMIDPFEQASAIWELCSAFWSLFQSYQQGPPGRLDQVQKPDLVLQIVPIKYIASFEASVILDASVYTNLAREVYDRCPPSVPSEDKMPLNIYSAPSFQLEEPIPRNIQFKLIADTPQDLMRENSYMHIGYAISLDGMWVTAAWTDPCGKSQTAVSYNLGQRPFTDVAKEIWQTTVEIMQVRRVTWRVCIAKAGVMEREELEAWVFLVQCPTVLNLFTTLLTIDTEPHLKFTPPVPPNATSHPHPGQPTPGSTPQPVVSPEQGLTPAATPVVETSGDPANDADARLVDLTDETWCIILAHRLHNSHSINEYRPALISGLLVKRGLSESTSAPPSSPDPLPGPIITGVNILWMGAVSPTRAATSPFPPGSGDGVSPGGAGATAAAAPNPQEPRYNSLTWTPTPQARAAAENLMREVLGQFRGLGTLARLRGVKGCRHGAVPWHVAVAVRGVKGLVRTLPS